MNYEQLEQDVIARLETLMPSGVIVVPTPESDADMQGKPTQKGRLTVMYSGSDYGDPGQNNFTRSTGQVVQNEVVMFEVLIQSRRLRTGVDAMYKLIALTKRALIGFKPTDCDRIYMKRQRIDIDQQDQSDLFNFVLSFETTTLAVEEYDTTTGNEGTISRITFDEAV